MTTWRSPHEVALDEELSTARAIARVVGALPPPAEVEACLGGCLAWHEAGSPWCGARGLGLEGPVTEDGLDRVVAFFDRHGWGGEVDVCAYADPGLAQGLARRGFRPHVFEVAFARGLDTPLELEGPGLAAGLRVRPLDLADAELCDGYARTLVRGFASGDDGGDGLSPERLREVMLQSLRDPAARAYVVLREGDGDDEPEGARVVGAGSVHVRGPSASLSGAATLPEWRRRGVQGALLRARVEHAREAGARQVVIKTLPGNPTERNALRAGFAPSYSVLQMLRPAPNG